MALADAQLSRISVVRFEENRLQIPDQFDVSIYDFIGKSGGRLFSARNRYAFCRLFAVTVATSIRGWKHGGLLRDKFSANAEVFTCRCAVIDCVGAVNLD